MSEYKKYMDLLHGDIASAGLVLRYYNKIFGFTPESEERKKLEYYHNAWNIITSAYPGGSDLKDKITKIMDGATSPEQKWQAYSIAMDNAIKAWNKVMSTRTNKQIKTM
jgi:hypothetical protein